MRIVFWGTYDLGKPRNRILFSGLKKCQIEVYECHADVWSDIEDKSEVIDTPTRLRLFVRWLTSYPRLILRYLRTPRHDAVLIGYMGQLDVLVIWLLAKLRRVPVIWDALMSLHVAVVVDRHLVASNSLLARLLYGWEWVACRAADLIITNTNAGADYWARHFKLPRERVRNVFIGVEIDRFPLRPSPEVDNCHRDPFTVLFYGTFIPSHGVKTIVRAARLLVDSPIHWVLIGRGQEGPEISNILENHPVPRLSWISWVPYDELVNWIHRADVCLGMFGDSSRAEHALGNKIYQILSAGSPLITRDSAGIRELINPGAPGVYLVPPADPAALADAIMKVFDERDALGRAVLHRDAVGEFEPVAVGRKVAALVIQQKETENSRGERRYWE